MNAMNETSPTKAADPASVFMVGACSRPSGSVAFSRLEKVGGMDHLGVDRLIQVDPSPAAEAQTAPPVPSAVDATPTNWFELAVDLCASGYISHDRFHKAVEAVREGVERA